MDNVYRILVGYDYSPLADRALGTAFALAGREKNAEVHVVHVAPAEPVPLVRYATVGAIDPIPMAADHVEGLEARIGRAMSAWQAQTHGTFSRLSVHTRVGAASHEIAQLASDLEVELVLVGTRGHTGLKHLLLGSVAEGVVRLAQCPVLVIKDPKEPVVIAEIAAACPRCLQERRDTGGEQLWCSQHREKHGRRHTYQYQSRVGAPDSAPLVVVESRGSN